MYEPASMHYITSTYTLGVWSMLTHSINIIGQSTMHVLNMYILYALNSLQIYYCYIILNDWCRIEIKA